MKKQYDFSKANRNPYIKGLKEMDEREFLASLEEGINFEKGRKAQVKVEYLPLRVNLNLVHTHKQHR